MATQSGEMLALGRKKCGPHWAAGSGINVSRRYRQRNSQHEIESASAGKVLEVAEMIWRCEGFLSRVRVKSRPTAVFSKSPRAAKPRREGRLRQWPRYKTSTVATTFAENTHDSSRGHKKEQAPQYLKLDNDKVLAEEDEVNDPIRGQATNACARSEPPPKEVLDAAKVVPFVPLTVLDMYA